MTSLSALKMGTFRGDEQADQAVEVAGLEEVAGGDIVRAQGQARKVARPDQAGEVRQVAADRAFPQEQVHPRLQLFLSFCCLGDLVVRIDARRHVSVEVVPRKARGVAVDGLAGK